MNKIKKDQNQEDQKLRSRSSWSRRSMASRPRKSCHHDQEDHVIICNSVSDTQLRQLRLRNWALRQRDCASFLSRQEGGDILQENDVLNIGWYSINNSIMHGIQTIDRLSRSFVRSITLRLISHPRRLIQRKYCCCWLLLLLLSSLVVVVVVIG